MLLLSLRHDRRVREELRRRGLLQPAEPARPVAASAWGVSPRAGPRDKNLRPRATRTAPSPIPATTRTRPPEPIPLSF